MEPTKPSSAHFKEAQNDAAGVFRRRHLGPERDEGSIQVAKRPEEDADDEDGAGDEEEEGAQAVPPRQQPQRLPDPI